MSTSRPTAGTEAICVSQKADGSFEVLEAPEVAWISDAVLERVEPNLHWDGKTLTINASNGVFVYEATGEREEIFPAFEVRRVETSLAAERVAEGRCMRCGNYPTICGHGLSFKDRLKSIGVQTLWAASSHN